MDIYLWKHIWFAVFFVGSALFYLIAIAVAIKGMVDVKELLGRMISKQSLQPTGEDKDKG